MHPPEGPTFRQLEYRNKYVVVCSRTSARWDWAVDLDERTVKGGHAASEEAAIEAAQRLIDSALAPGQRRMRLVKSSRDGRREDDGA